MLKKILAVVLSALIIANNTLPILADNNTEILYLENETTLRSSEFDVEESGISIIESEEDSEIVAPETINETETTDNAETNNEEEPTIKSEEETSISDTIELETESDTESEIESDTESETEIGTESETESNTETNTETELETESKTEPESESEIESETVIKTESETVIETKSQIETIASDSEIKFDIEEIATQSEINTEICEESEEKYLTAYIPEEYEVPIIENIDEENDDKIFRASVLPDKYDSREQINGSTGLSYIPTVRDQGPFGSCWAFSTIAMFEASLRIKGLVKTESESDLSEAALCYYTYGLENITNNSSYIDSPGLEGHDFVKIKNGNFASRGGNLAIALLTSSAYVGALVENSDTSYSRLTQFEGKEKEYTLNKNYAFKRNNFVLENAYIINKANIDIIKQKIIDNGAVGISYYAGQSNIASSSSDDAYMHKNGSEYYYFTNIDSDYANHAIAIVGWNDNIPRDYFYINDNGAIYKPNNPGGWLCRNSWGDDYRLSNNGYFWMSYEEPSLSPNMYAVDMMKADKYKYNYHYDTTGYTTFVGETATSTNRAAFANIFKVPTGKTHLLEAASVAINSTNTVLTVDVYTNDNEMTSPSDGVLKSSVTVEKETSGIFTIPLNDKVLLKGGTYFSIIVRGYSKNTNTKNLYIYYDSCGTLGNIGEESNNPITFYNAAESGQSFYTTYNTDSKSYDDWSDLNPMVFPIQGYTNDKFGSNYRIKALANDAVIVKISFDPNGGDGTMNELSILSNEPTKLPQNIFTKKGYKFLKWIDQNGEEYDDKATIETNKDLTLKAVWTALESETSTSESTTSPKETSVAPSESTTSPKETSVAPSESTTSPKETSVAPSESTTSPKETSVAPSESTTSPKESSTSITESTTSPRESSIAPSESSSPNSGNSSSSSSSRGTSGSSSGGSSSGLGRVSTNVVSNDFGPNNIVESSNDKNPTKVKIDRSVTNVYDSSAAVWVLNDNIGKWNLRLQNDDGSITNLKNGFIQLNGYRTLMQNNQRVEVFASDTYFFDEEGNMVTGWVQTSEDKWYYFNTENNSEIGKMAFGWREINGSWYYFALEGSLYKNKTTPDGFTVDEEGKWIE